MRYSTNNLLVLGAFLKSDLPLAGADIINRFGLLSGSIYPLLARLERGGILESRWEGGDPRILNRPNRREYLLTAKGRVEAEQEITKARTKVSVFARLLDITAPPHTE